LIGDDRDTGRATGARLDLALANADVSSSVFPLGAEEGATPFTTLEEEATMNPKNATLAAIVGISSVFLLRTLGTFFPSLFHHRYVAEGAIWVHLLSALAVAFFFTAFFLGPARWNRRTLRHASALAAAGAGVAALAPIQALLRIHGVAVFSPLGRSPLIEPWAPLLATLTALFFFAVYRRDMDPQERAKLRGPATAAMAGYGVATVLNLIVLALYLSSGELRWLTEISPAVAIGSLPVVAAAVAAILSFYVAFLRTLPPESAAQVAP
jgi:hypothetical protein